ncbi:MAG: metal-dependent hydrolase, partial [Candidatus Thorarchaeota archaeon]
RNNSTISDIIWILSEVFEFFLLFHVAVPLIICEIPFIKKKFEFNRLTLIIGSLLPDFIDKSLLFMNIGFGRGFSHTILFSLICVVIIYFIVKKKTSIAIPFFLGLILHLILDLPEVPLFYPFIAYDFLVVEDPLGLWLYKLFNDPGVYWTEIAGILILTFISINNRLFNWKNLVRFLKRNTALENNQNTTEPYKV